MGKRESISPSLRWSVFSRDGFTCRYCGAQAGQEGVELHADHLVSVKEGGGSTYDNLVTACQKCNGGKGARSLKTAPTPKEVVKRVQGRAATLAIQAEAMAEAIEAEKTLKQQAVDLKCAAYETDSVHMEKGEDTCILNLCREFGADMVLRWYRAAYARGVKEWKAVRYVCGIARNVRERQQQGVA